MSEALPQYIQFANTFGHDRLPIEDFLTPQERRIANMVLSDLEAEYNKIMQKKSSLSSISRHLILRRVDRLIAEGTIKISRPPI